MREKIDRFMWKASGRLVGAFVVTCAFVAVAGIVVTGWVEQARAS